MILHEAWRRVRGPRKGVHAKDQRDITAALRSQTAAGSDCPQLPDRASHRASLPGALCRHRSRLAFVARLGQHPVGTVVVWESTRTSDRSHEPAYAGLCGPSRRDAKTFASHAATALGGVPYSATRWLRL